ncbi:alpha/beta hydrolase [Paractinoplanes atraurantiacus]|uniref:Carboxylesterase n=1 Tax=Paractinoplanes atraurantiacus TaxID=1036182 RepID=A0A285I4M3_9ACTN|nr:alpha/beta fold hydrolase [Actinoplanes atraurantiacus]SNY42920.1 carboxylesterase [Actinoplanes atraurantiacus]
MELIDACSRLLSHGGRTPRAVLLLHGYTLGPDQYDDLARDYFERGYNVWVPRAPHEVTVSSLTAYASEALDTVAGLGDEVTVVGISGGAVLATWLAQTRGDAVRHLLLLSPFFGPAQVPAWAVRPLTFLYGRGLLPDRITSRGYSLAAVTRYLTIVHRLPDPPRWTRLRSIAVAISETDGVVDPVAAVTVPRRIAEACGIRLLTWTLPSSLGVGHDTLALTGSEAAGLRKRYIELSEGRP